jgi:hypothetical protein
MLTKVFDLLKLNMWGTVISTSIITLLIMVLLHQTYNHLQATLTVPKISDLVQRPEKKYKEINDIIETPVVSATPVNTTEMKDELRTFLTRLRH